MPLIEDSTGNQLTYQVIGAAMTVHNRLGSGYKEEVYERALHAELTSQGVPVVRQARVDVFYDEDQIALFLLDLLVSEQVIVEVKAFQHQLTNDEIAQVVNYLKATGLKVALLINFGRRKLEFRRILPPKNLDDPLQRVGRDNVRKSFLPDPENSE